MPQQEFDGKATQAAKQTAASAFINAMQDGIQEGLEERMEAHTLNGVESGGALSISSTNIVIAAGVFWVEGKEYNPANSTIAFSASDPANTYFLYVTPLDDVTPYVKSTSDPGAGFLVLGTVVWDGASVLSSLVDFAPKGIIPWKEQINIAGALSDGDDGFAVFAGQDGRSFVIEGVKGMLENKGSANGPTYLSTYQGVGGSEAAINSTGTRRLWFAHGDTDRVVKAGGEPEQNRTVADGSVIRVRVDNAPNGAVATGAADAWVCVFGRLA